MTVRPRGGPFDPHRSLKPAVVQALIAATLLAGILLLVGTNIHFLSQSSIIEGETIPGGDTPGTTILTRPRDTTLVIYVYNAADAEHARNFAYFLRYGIADDGAAYRIIITNGPEVKEFPKLPTLPPNAEYIKLEVGACTSTWGAIAEAMGALPVPDYEYFIVIDSAVRGPYLPPYVTSQSNPIHWTEAFTSKIKGQVKLVGSTISCEGAPKEGNAAGEWRGNPAVSPHAWATDATGWRLLAQQPAIFMCHNNTWESRYHADVGASLAVMRAGWTIDTLLTRYQGVDWTAAASWQCNQRVRPDYEHHYDGISISPYETVFVPVSESTASARWSIAETADRYERWQDRLLRPPESRPGVHTNQWIATHWTAKSEKLVYMNARGPGCFDFGYYLEQNPDLRGTIGTVSANGEVAVDDLMVWEHFVLLGQFHARKHRFTCAMPTGNSFRVAYVMSRGPRCFDYTYYLDQHKDLQSAGMADPLDLFYHFAEFGQFEKRKIRFTCADTMYGLPRGFDTEPPGSLGGAGVEGGVEQEAEDAAEVLARQGDAGDAVQQAIKGVLVSETAKDFAAAGANKRNPLLR